MCLAFHLSISHQDQVCRPPFESGGAHLQGPGSRNHNSEPVQCSDKRLWLTVDSHPGVESCSTSIWESKCMAGPSGEGGSASLVCPRLRPLPGCMQQQDADLQPLDLSRPHDIGPEMRARSRRVRHAATKYSGQSLILPLEAHSNKACPSIPWGGMSQVEGQPEKKTYAGPILKTVLRASSFQGLFVI